MDPGKFHRLFAERKLKEPLSKRVAWWKEFESQFSTFFAAESEWCEALHRKFAGEHIVILRPATVGADRKEVHFYGESKIHTHEYHPMAGATGTLKEFETIELFNVRSARVVSRQEAFYVDRYGRRGATVTDFANNLIKYWDIASCDELRTTVENFSQMREDIRYQVINAEAEKQIRENLKGENPTRFYFALNRDEDVYEEKFLEVLRKNHYYPITTLGRFREHLRGGSKKDFRKWLARQYLIQNLETSGFYRKHQDEIHGIIQYNRVIVPIHGK